MVPPPAPPPSPMSSRDLSPSPAPRNHFAEPATSSSQPPNHIRLPPLRPQFPARGSLICLYNPADRQPIRYVNQSRLPAGYTPVVSTGDVYPPIFAPEPRDSFESAVVWNTVPGRRVMVQSGVYSPMLARSLSMPRRRRSSTPSSQMRYVTNTYTLSNIAKWCSTILEYFW